MPNPKPPSLRTSQLIEAANTIGLDIKGRGLHLKVDDAELAKRKAQWTAPAKPERGYRRLTVDTVTQADQGCDFDFLVER